MKRIISLLLILAVVFAFAGCNLSKHQRNEQTRETADGIKPSGYEKNILTFLTEEEVKIVAARYYVGTEDSRYEFEYRFEELDKNKIADFEKTFRNIQYHTVSGNNPDERGFVPNDSRGDRGIELSLDNGKYLVCDGTRLALGFEPVDSINFSDQVGWMCAIKITGCDYWDLMKQYFNTIE